MKAYNDTWIIMIDMINLKLHGFELCGHNLNTLYIIDQRKCI